MFRGEAEPFAVLHETHSGVVVLYGDRAYKTKRPVVTDFLDFGTPERRERAIARELELNRRLAPDVYLGVGHFQPPGGGPAEPVLVMRRLPDQARLTRLLTDPMATDAALDGLVRLLAEFHDTAARSDRISGAATLAAVRARWRSVLHGLTRPPLAPDTVARAEELADRFLDGRGPLFEQRIAEGRIVDGHGDLRAGDIFVVPDGFRVIDCLDFDDELRHVDRIDDIAFLAMDLEFEGASWAATELARDYRTHTADPAPMSLWHFYIAYRAAVRAKVNCLRHAQGDPRAADHAVRHVEIALDHLQSATIRIALVGGLPGTGKSTIAAALAEATGATVLSTDRIRAELRATGVITGASGNFGEGAYTRSAVDRVYQELLDRAREHLGQGRSIVLDATWSGAYHREQALRLAAETATEPIEIRCAAPTSVTSARITARSGGDSEATPAIASALASVADPWPAASVLDTTHPVADNVARAVTRWQRAHQPGPVS
ncbi:hypothetical protein EBN03_10725 [Nocardia stercoris]|uniref:Uncharacterized protein n=2 Tax=Nocardia stercoris TaxID=2483361 RepID=A0A3M2LAI8_9NOCA|nr:hypothetical protein EBN03_10725 [Nocardia stercoris]